jgi:chromatin remodeling complex protein RSC6
MQTRSGKTYNTNTTTSSLEKSHLSNAVRFRCFIEPEPKKISNELAKFLGKPPGTKMLRTEVARHIHKYIQTNNLQDKQNGRKINPDKKLAALLKLGKNDELSYFNMQRYIKPHFV